MRENILVKESGKDMMLYDINADTLHVLNPTARLIYTLYTSGKRLSEIEKALREEFQYDAHHDINTDIQNCLAELRKKGLIREK